MTPARTILLFTILLAAGCSALAVPRMPRMNIWPGGKAPDRLVMAAEARAQTRARAPDGAWVVADPVAGSDYRRDFAANCLADARGTACADHAPVELPAGAQTAPQVTGRVAIAFAALPDNSRCTGEARQGQTPAEENLLAVRGFSGANGVFPRARSVARMAGNGDAIGWNDIADPSRFLALCSGMGG